VRPRLIPGGDPVGGGAFAVARLIGEVSRAWGQRGLGTIYGAFNRVGALERLSCQVEFDRDSRFELPVFDSYWAPTIIGGRPYEPELMHLLAHARELSPKPAFIDCGANYGYWSVIASGPLLGLPRVLAVEANPVTFRRLERNAALNHDRFVCINHAVSDRSGEVVRLGQSSHARDHAQTFIDESGSSDLPGVETITIDDAIEQRGWADQRHFIFKLDVEGHEERAIRGSQTTRDRGEHLLVFEDWARHGFQILGSLLRGGYRAFFVSTAGTCRAIASAAEARGHAATDGKLAGASNLVATRPGTHYCSWLEGWSRR
jgi:FkbM family methyltransferase